MRAEIITDADALRGLEPAWWALWARQTRPTPFTSPAWLVPWWLAFSPGPLMCVAVWHESRLAALAPLYLEPGEAGRRLLPLGISLSDYSDILVDPDLACGAAEELTAALDAVGETWDLWSAEEAPFGAAVLDMALPASWTEAREPQSVCPVIALNSEFPQTVVRPAMLRKWRMACHRVRRRTHRFETADPDSVEGMLQSLFSLHEARWRLRGQGGVLLDPRVRKFHLSAAPHLLDAGLLRLRTVLIEGRVAGVYYGLQDRRSAYAYLGGFDPDFSFESPGTVLIGAALEDAAAAGCSEYDFLRGPEPYKFGWGATARSNTRRTFRRAGR